MKIPMTEMKTVKFPNIPADDLPYILKRIEESGGTVDSVTPEGDGEFTIVATFPVEPAPEIKNAMGE